MRKIILATNIAETSVTIDDVVYVVDPGIHRQSRFDIEKGVMCLDNQWISQSSAEQRRGRAGRVQPGEAFRLYSKSTHTNMPAYSMPEILRSSLTKIVLDAKAYSHNSDIMEFFHALPCPPEEMVLLKAIDELKDLELLDDNENLTPLGKVLSEFQLPPKLSKAMIQSIIYRCVTPIVDIATIYSSDSAVFSTALVDKKGIRQTKSKLCKTSDHIAMMILFEQWLNFMSDEEFQEATQFCHRNNLVGYKLNTLRSKLHYI